MSKIICDVCGTSFPETATQCPICGCVRSSDVTVIAGDTNEAEQIASGTYTYVKGGRFSKNNVKRRTRSQQAEDVSAEPSEEKQPKKQKDIGLIIAVCVLLLAIVSVVIYIAMHFFATGQKPADNADNTVNNDTPSISDTIEQTAGDDIPCVDILISKTTVELTSVDAACLLNVTTDPADTTDEVLFTTADELVATVSAEGKIIAVGPGETIITVTCGDAKAECRVVCNIVTAQPEVETPQEETPVVNNTEFTLNRTDFTLSTRGQTWKLYNGDIPAEQITWTSDNEKVATIVNGVVTAVGSGMTKVHGEYNGVKVSCIVRCSKAMGAAPETEQPVDSTEAGA